MSNSSVSSFSKQQVGALLSAALYTASAHAITIRFEAVPALPNSSGYSVSGMSADGSTFFGQLTLASQSNAFRWTRAGGYQTLGIFFDHTSSNATGSSADGTIILGNCYHTLSMGRKYSDAFLWTPGGGQVKITMHGAPSWDDTTVYPTQLSADGSFFVGYTIPAAVFGEDYSRAFLRNNTTGAMTYPDPAPTYDWNHSFAASADGSIIVGDQKQPTDLAARWVGGIAQSLGKLSGDSTSSARLCSADGSVIVGESYGSGGSRKAFRWKSSGMVQLSPLAGQTGATAKCMSADGTFIAGTCNDRALFWKNSTTPTELKPYLASRGVDVSAWSSITTINGVSADGNKLVGIGFRNGVRTVWLADLDYQCHADLDLNSLVEDTDFVLFASAYETFDCADPAMPIACPADLNGDHFVDDADFVVFAAAYDELACP
ncbi:MAG: hypothetical protein J0L78_16125 [Planctomycetes bacterium]|nr:hypothetical protein [Planctomycetota bacterium]